mmetsp:Transcript_9446/g.26481  ORF Transcript_9446/g.26481 Transcript_9446/m.26481 type:complete len:195 (-) Transcript_9446:1751-2335(-)
METIGTIISRFIKLITGSPVAAPLAPHPSSDSTLGFSTPVLSVGTQWVLEPPWLDLNVGLGTGDTGRGIPGGEVRTGDRRFGDRGDLRLRNGEDGLGPRGEVPRLERPEALLDIEEREDCSNDDCSGTSPMSESDIERTGSNGKAGASEAPSSAAVASSSRTWSGFPSCRKVRSAMTTPKKGSFGPLLCEYSSR